MKSVLDVACGSGRLLLPLAERGYRVCGLDLSREMIEFTRESAAARTLAVELFVAGMNCFETNQKFEAAICMLDSFRYLLTTEDILQHLTCVAKAIVPGGIYVIDFSLLENFNVLHAERRKSERKGVKVDVQWRQFPAYDMINQLIDVEFVVDVDDNGKKVKLVQRDKTRVIFPQEFKTLVRLSNFDFVEWFTDDFNFNIKFPDAERAWWLVSVLKKRCN